MLESVGSIGYAATSVRTVLDCTGLYRQAFYDNFADKDHCYLKALDVGVARVSELVAAAAASEEDWQGKLRAGLSALLEFLEAEPDVGRALIVEVHAAGAEALKRRDATMSRAAAFFDQARLKSNRSEPGSEIAAQAVVGSIQAVLHSRLAAREDGGLRDLLPELMYLAVLPYFGVEAASAELQPAGA